MHHKTWQIPPKKALGTWKGLAWGYLGVCKKQVPAGSKIFAFFWAGFIQYTRCLMKKGARAQNMANSNTVKK